MTAGGTPVRRRAALGAIDAGSANAARARGCEKHPSDDLSAPPAPAAGAPTADSLGAVLDSPAAVVHSESCRLKSTGTSALGRSNCSTAASSVRQRSGACGLRRCSGAPALTPSTAGAAPLTYCPGGAALLLTALLPLALPPTSAWRPALTTSPAADARHDAVGTAVS